MERSGYHRSYTDKVKGGQGERVITETERERGYSVKCCGCIPMCFDPTGPLIRGDTKVFARPSGFLRLLQLIPLIVAFIAVELALWCFHGIRSYRFFSTVTMALIWFNILFFLIYLCQCQWRTMCDCFILDFIYHAVAILLLIISSIFLALNVCSAGHIVGAVFGFIAALLYIISAVFLLREYRKFRKTCAQEKAMCDLNRSTMSSTTTGPPPQWQTSDSPPNSWRPQPVMYPPPSAYDRDGRPVNYYPSQPTNPVRPGQAGGVQPGPYYVEDMDRPIRQVPIQLTEPDYYRGDGLRGPPYEPDYPPTPGVTSYRAEEIRRW